MVTTIQVDEQTLELLKKLKREMVVASYAEAITRMAAERTRGKSFGGILQKYYKKKPLKEILKDLRDKHDRF
ncbi:MAG: hypothetical protein Q8L29_01840 [archaeon]|nr:hypothetical protein [archaeon]